MADILTQLQDCLDQLSTQLYASLRYLSTHHPSSALSSSNNPQAPNSTNQSLPLHPATDTDPAQLPDDETTFESAKKELAGDLVFKVKQIEYLVDRLPGVENSREAQEDRIRVLEGILRESERERKDGGVQRDSWLEKLDGVLGQIKR